MLSKFAGLVGKWMFCVLVVFGVSACGGGSADNSVTPVSKRIVKLEVQIGNGTNSSHQTSLLLNESSDISVVAHFNDQSRQMVTSEVTWVVSDPLVMDIVFGTKMALKAKSLGRATINAWYKGLKSDSITVEVKAPQITHIQLSKVSSRSGIGAEISFPLGTQERFSVASVYEDGKVEDITSKVKWHSTVLDAVEFYPNGSVKSKKIGKAQISAAYSGFDSNSIEIEVTAATLSRLELIPFNQGVPLGTSRSINVEGVFSDLSKKDLTNSVRWHSDITAIASVSQGIVKANKQGKAKITASMQGKEVSTEVTVTSAVLQSISVTPNQSQIPAGLKLNFKALGHYSDGQNIDVTNKVIWQTDNPSIASFKGASLSAIKPGSVKVTAAMSLISSESVNVEVKLASLQKLLISAKNNSVPKGNRLQLKAEALYTDNSRVDVTDQTSWSLGSTDFATISHLGLLTALKEGRVSINALFQSLSVKYAVDVTSAVLERIEIKQKNTELYRSISQTVHLNAIGYYSDGSSADVTQSTNWSTPSSNIMVTVSGTVWPVSAGNAQVTASLGHINSLPAGIKVNDADVRQIQVTPSDLSVVQGDWRRLVAEVTLEDGKKVDVSTSANFFANNVWKISDSDVASLVYVIFSAKNVGSTTIHGEFKSKVSGKTISSNSVNVNVKPMRICGGKVNDTHVGNAATACLKVVEFNGKQFTGTPSKALMDYMGGYSLGADAAEPFGRHYHSVYSESGRWGPKGDFVKFRNNPSLTGVGEAWSFCSKLGHMNFNGRRYWRLATLSELSELRKDGDMHKRFGWPTSSYYWTGSKYTGDEPGERHHALELMLNAFHIYPLNTDGNYISCVSSSQ
ncbi:putative Bacterial Ig-like, group 2 [Vibrio nigripulchritudo SFn27]|uniref:Putative Bacterial Ig-like, group 2 n=1 Tax=Vibrio nigripulchritudo TaxID=28173 RepID=U4KGI5_9VIBR|nr:Ig-like domain-containing protein [Vibrio nigripulchritudo]CCN85143.1 putative Bacterial Ig-like, group 2 [Vibrio nigripulchritudo BLFn1]CCN90355.1 putative Bacterial Ig-like, group 2 [Vibrio nigripulchritudo SFn27]CCN94032.1 putative Bacterial Ig-like, group 2 [Vibrio nigripulchritudo ENn2]CCO42385.1 putative Bacterial Ig-like, group 2 [Vibrio nigripulchritudo SFn135]CCO51512.1 putative Bacterial Ig-like, group 2 [Vibrio nigripulchritudo Wn13]